MFSCGIPTICTLDNVKVAKGSTTDTEIFFTISGTDPDLAIVSSSNPGLVLCYVATDDIVIDDSAVTKAFKDKVIFKVTIEDDNSILSYGDGDKLYIFQADASGTRVGSPSYCLNLHPYIADTTMYADLTLKKQSTQEYTIGLISKKLYTSSSVIQGKSFIHVFAAFTAEQGNFSNNYISQMVYLGYLPL